MTSNRLLVALAVVAALDVACGGGGGSTGSSGTTGTTGPTGPSPTLTGIALPKEVSALPTGASSGAGLRTKALLATPPAGSDYDKARTFKFVSERSLSQFDILNTIFNAMAQTHYDDPAVLNRGAYAAMVTWEEKDEKSQDQKRLVKWVVESTRESATHPNVVKAWFRMPMMNDQPFTIQAQVVVETAPTQASDGSYADYGVWRMDVKVLETGMPFRFVASASRDAQGRAVIQMGQVEPGKNGTPLQTRGILHKAAQSGSGKVVYPDWEACNQPDCVPAEVPVAYVYDAQTVTLRKGTGQAVTKARNSFVDIVNRYGLFDATTGENVAKTRQFGFPIRGSAGGVETFGYYGAWQGRHQVWANGQAVPGGVPVQRADVPPDQSPPTFTTSPVFTGILVKRTYAPASLSDLTGLAVETWDNASFQLGFDGTKWCRDPVLGSPPQPPPPGSPPAMPYATCSAQSPDFTDFASLVIDPADKRKNVTILQPAMGQPLIYVYEGGAFYPATKDMGGQNPVKTSDVAKAFAAGDFLQVNLGGPIYVSYDGSAWVRKAVESFDEQTWTATFKPSSFDVRYVLQEGREYYFNNSGTSYVVKLVGGVEDVKLEVQSVAHPWDATTLVPAGTRFRQQWCGQPDCAGASTYAFVTDATSLDYMKLVYAEIGTGDTSRQVGDLVQTGMWGLSATIGGETVQFNWDYPQQGQDFGGAQQYLLRADGTCVQLDDPIRLEQVTLQNGTVSRPFLLQFDGNWMQGLPNVFDDLRKAGFEVDDTIKAKAFSIPSGTVIGPYVVKQLQVSEYMARSSAAPLDLTEASAIDLSTVPTFVEHGMGAIPDPAPLRYSEGNPIAP